MLNLEEQKVLKYIKINREWFSDLETFFILSNIEFGLNPDVNPEEFTIEDIQIFKRIYYDALTKQTFYDASLQIFNSWKLIRTKIESIGRGSANITQ